MRFAFIFPFGLLPRIFLLLTFSSLRFFLGPVSACWPGEVGGPAVVVLFEGGLEFFGGGGGVAGLRGDGEGFLLGGIGGDVEEVAASVELVVVVEGELAEAARRAGSTSCRSTRGACRFRR